MKRTLVVVPCYNEELRIKAQVFLRFVRSWRSVGFIFVNDGSTDNTQAALCDLCAMAPKSMSVLSLEKNVGKAEAVRRGMLMALASPGVRYVGYWDADLATPLQVIRRFVRIHRRAGNLVMVMGARVQLFGRKIIRHRPRHYLGRLFAEAASRILSLPVYDTQCGAKLFRANALTRRLFEVPFETRWVFDVEILARLICWTTERREDALQRLLYEVPLQRWEDVGGSKCRVLDYVLAARDLVIVWHKYMRGRRLNQQTRGSSCTVTARNWKPWAGLAWSNHSPSQRESI